MTHRGITISFPAIEAPPMLKGMFKLMRRGLRHYLIEPRLVKIYRQRREPFAHRTPEGLVFGLVPDEYIDGAIAVEGIYEKSFLDYVGSILPAKAIMLDMGANIGSHAIYLADQCEMIHCFEPNPRAAERLRWNIEANSFGDRITVHEYGLGDKDEVLNFHENIRGNLGASSFTRGEEVPLGFRALKLHVKRADQAVEALNLPRIDFIKIDVEGMEVAVLTALKSIIKQFRPIVSFEHHEHLVEAGTFQRLRDVFEGYQFMEPCRAPAGSALSKLLWNIRNDGGPVLQEITEPERRTYENIFAFPCGKP